MRFTSRLSLGLILIGMAAVPATSPAADDPVALSETDHYNQGVALYRAEQFQESADAFRKAAAASDPLLAARARFNLGNADYARAVASIDSQDPSAAAEAIESLRSAIESYRSALRIAPKDDDARFNLELASKLMRQLEQQQQQQQGQEGQEPQQDKEEQEAGEQEEQNGESQPEQQQQQSSQPENEQPENEQPDEQPNESSSGENQEGDGDNQESEQNPQANEGEKDSNDQPQQQQPDGSGAEPQDQASADPAEQDESNKSQPRPDNSEGDQRNDDGTSEQDSAELNETQETPEGELTAANAAETDQPAADESEGLSGQPLQMTQEEARKMLQAIRDRDMLRRLRRQAAQRARQIPVERDW